MIACAKIICFAEGRVSFGTTARPAPGPATSLTADRRPGRRRRQMAALQCSRTARVSAGCAAAALRELRRQVSRRLRPVAAPAQLLDRAGPAGLGLPPPVHGVADHRRRVLVARRAVRPSLCQRRAARDRHRACGATRAMPPIARRLLLRPGLLKVEFTHGRRVDEVEFTPAWVRVEPAHGDRSLIELSGEGKRIAVGRFVRPELRRALAEELRAAIRRCGSALPAARPASAVAPSNPEDVASHHDV